MTVHPVLRVRFLFCLSSICASRLWIQAAQSYVRVSHRLLRSKLRSRFPLTLSKCSSLNVSVPVWMRFQDDQCLHALFGFCAADSFAASQLQV